MKASINLLPSEYAVSEKQQQKFARVQTLSVTFIMILFLVTSVLVALRIIQSKDILDQEDRIKQLEAQIGQSKDKEAALFVLKNRLTSISKIVKSPSKQLVNYQYAEQKLPQEITITSVSADRGGSLALAMLVPDVNSLETAIGVLTDPSAFEKFKQVDVENLARSQDGIYKVSLRIVPK